MLQISTERKKDKARLRGKDDPLGIVQKNEIGPYYQIVYA